MQSSSFRVLPWLILLLLLIPDLQQQRFLQHSIVMHAAAATATPDQIELPRIELQRFHVEYDIPSKSFHPSQQDRSMQDTAMTYEPIRIAFDTRVLDSLYGLGNTEVDAKIDFIKSTILPQTAKKWAQHLYVPPVVSFLSPIPVGPDTCGGLYSDFLTSSIQYTDADLVIIVGGDPSQICAAGTLAYAFPCNIDTRFDRPITGTFHFCLAKLSSTSLQVSDGTSILESLSGSNIPAYYSAYTNATFYPEKLGISILDVTIHEVAHILGFTELLYPYTRDEFGVPRTARDANNTPVPTTRVCGNGTSNFGYFPPESVVQVVQPSSTTDPNRYEHYFVTERVRAISQLHFNCSTLMGGRLEDVAVGARPCYGSHWHERLYYSELLSPTVSEGSENILSLLTLAFMEDTGWYKVDYRGAGYPSFGIGAGCDFVTEPCINSTTGEVLSVAENEFCNTPLYLDDGGVPSLESLNNVLCDPSHQSWAICDLSDLRSFDANERTYFTGNDALLSTIFFQRADNCPIPSLNLGIDCFDDSIAYNEFYVGESVGPNSRCLNAYTETTSVGRTYHPACIRVTCDLTEGVVRIGQNETEQICEYDGQLLVVPGERNDGATFICPRLATVCPALFTCPDGCFARGECVYNIVDGNGRTVPTCRCFDTNNTHPSCAPSFIVNRSTNTTTPQPIASPVALPSFVNSPILNPAVISPISTVPPNPPPSTQPTAPPTQPVPSTGMTPNGASSPTILQRTDAPTTSQSSSGSSSFSYYYVPVMTTAVATVIFLWTGHWCIVN